MAIQDIFTERRVDTYPAIDPKRPELSLKGKTIIVTGAGTGIGRNTVLEIAKTGSGPVHIIGRTAKTLNETKEIVEKEVPGAHIVIHSADVADEPALTKIAKQVGQWDVLITNAGYLPGQASAAETDIKDWWTGFEINVKGAFVPIKAFVPTHKHGASIVGISSAVTIFPSQAPMLKGQSSYVASKLALSKVYEFLANDYDVNDLQILTIHPGLIKTPMSDKVDLPAEIPFDDVNLASHFIIWAASKEAAVANGKFLSCNWDVDQILAQKEKLQDPGFLTFGLQT